MEFRLAVRCSRMVSFRKACAHLIVDKDRKPAWSPPRLADVSDALLRRYLAPLPAAEEIGLGVSAGRGGDGPLPAAAARRREDATPPLTRSGARQAEPTSARSAQAAVRRASRRRAAAAKQAPHHRLAAGAMPWETSKRQAAGGEEGLKTRGDPHGVSPGLPIRRRPAQWSGHRRQRSCGAHRAPGSHRSAGHGAWSGGCPTSRDR